jgi:capsular exopolysaccharide synthesis family protein
VRTEGGLPELLEALRWRWKPTVVIAVCVLAGAWIVVDRLPSQYDGEAVVAFAPRPDVPSASADTVRVVVPKYVDYVTAPATRSLVAGRLGVGTSSLKGNVDATLARDTGTLTVRVRLRSPIRAADAANAFADQLVTFAKNDPLLQPELIAPATTPTGPSAPPRKLLLGAALALGLLLGAGVAVLLERGRPRLRSWREIAQLTGYPVLGRVPVSRAIHGRAATAFGDPIVGASFRTLRANLEQILRDREIKAILVTSPSSADGKTTVAALLAEALSRLGARTLLVDADLRRPGVGPLFSLNGDKGLAAVLHGDAVLRSSVQKGWVPNLWVLPTTADRGAGDLLARGFNKVAREAMANFDFVVIDTAPLIGADDARAIATGLDSHGVLLVVSAGSESDLVNEAILAMESLNAPLLGIVGNRLKESRQAYYYAT